MKEFITSSQLFWATPEYSGKLILILSIISALMLIIGIAVWFAMKNKAMEIPPYEEVKNKLTSLFVACGAIGLFLAFFSWQEIPYLSSRLLVLILILVFIIWLIIILVYIKRNFYRKLEKFKQDERYKKYLPRAKTHNRV